MDPISQIEESAMHYLALGGLPLDELIAAINQICDDAEDDPNRAVVAKIASPPTGAAWPGTVSIASINRWERCVRRFERLPTLTVAVAAGPCSGYALDVLLASDYRVGTADLLLLPAANEGHLWPGMGLYRLAQQLGGATARRLLFALEEPMSVHEARQVGIIDAIAEDLDEALSQIAGRFIGRHGAEHRIRRVLILEAPSISYEEALGTHLAACDRELRRLSSEAFAQEPEHGD